MDRKQLDMIVQIACSTLEPAGFLCIEAEWVSQSRVLRVYLDHLNPGDQTQVNLDDCVKATKALDLNPDLEGAVQGAFTLEVSSPGVERPLRQVSHFKGHLGATIEVKLQKPFDERKHAIGALKKVSSLEHSAGGSMITLETNRGEWTFPWDHLQKAHLVFDWNSV